LTNGAAGHLVDRESWAEEYAMLVASETRILENSFRKFVEAAWPIIEPARQFMSNWHIDAICEHLEACSRGQIQNLLVSMPPRHMKSLTCSVFFPAWEWTTRPWLRYLYASYAAELAERDGVKCRTIFRSRWWQERWGTRWKLIKDEEKKLENDLHGVRISTGVGGGATGEGGDRLIVDDAHKIEQAESDVERKSVLDWWDGTMASRADEPATVVRIIFGQRTHQGDLLGHLIAQGGWEHLDIPEEYDPPKLVVVAGRATGEKPTTVLGWSDPRTEPGELLWPKRVGPAAVAQLKKMGAYRYNALYQQKPSPPGGGIYQRTWWRFYDGPPEEKAKDCETVIQSWDMAFKDVESGSRVCGLVMGTKGARAYLLDRACDHWDFIKTCQQFVLLSLKWPEAILKIVEAKANGPAVISALSQKVPGILGIEVKGSKEARAQATSPVCEAGNVFLPRKEYAPWVEEFVEELANFPKGRYNDNVDAFSQAMDRLFGGHTFDIDELLPGTPDEAREETRNSELEYDQEDEEIEKELKAEGWV
jgi:predicted phage terminase large subunit-like protein